MQMVRQYQQKDLNFRRVFLQALNLAGNKFEDLNIFLTFIISFKILIFNQLILILLL
jgi:hypothetical protein